MIGGRRAAGAPAAQVARDRLLGRLRPPGLHPPPQVEVRDQPRQRRQVGRDHLVGDDREQREPGVDAGGGERAEHPALGAADAARQREQVAERAEEVAEDDRADRGRLAERVERGPQHGDVERPPDERPDEDARAVVDDRDREPRRVAGHPRHRREPCRDPPAAARLLRHRRDAALDVARDLEHQQDQRNDDPADRDRDPAERGRHVGQHAGDDDQSADQQRAPCRPSRGSP